MTSIQHSAKSDAWLTPLPIVKLVRYALGQIDLDPASSSLANERIRASRYINEQEDGLSTDWPAWCSVYINPPGGKAGKRGKTIQFWQKLMEYRATGSLKHAIWMGFSIEQLQSTQNKGCPAMGEFPLCIPARRIAFDDEVGVNRSSPSHSNVIAYIPGSVDNTDGFIEAFHSLGTIL